MADNAPALIWVTDASGACTYISQRWCEYTDTTLDENLGFGWTNCVHPDDRTESRRIFLEANEHHAPFSLDYRLRRHDGEYRWAVDMAEPRFDRSGAFQGYIGTVADVHERELAAEALRTAAAELEQADKQKTEFLAILGHELRNPLAPIRMGLELLRLNAGNAERDEQIRGMMERQTQQMVRLIDDLLDVSRINRGKFELRKCQVELRAVVESAVEAIQPDIDDANHQLSIDLPAEPIQLYADPNRLAQIFSNLLSNSAKYTPDGGRISLSGSAQAGDLLVRITDSGIGIPKDLQGDIFDMFAQIDRPLEKSHRGLGIGLTLVKQLVELHGGTIEADSQGENQGSEFRVRMPILVESPTHAGLPPAVDGDGKPGSWLRVLVVDDNRAAADMLNMVVKMLGNEARTAYDGVEAVAEAEKFRPHVILMDLGMPHMDGFEAARRIRQHDWGENIVLVALTGWGQEKDRQETMAAGFDQHLVKPAEPSELQQLLVDVGKSQ